MTLKGIGKQRKKERKEKNITISSIFFLLSKSKPLFTKNNEETNRSIYELTGLFGNESLASPPLSILVHSFIWIACSSSLIT